MIDYYSNGPEDITLEKQVVEYAGLPVGIVVPDHGRLKFLAVKFDVHFLDGRHFASIDDVVHAISQSVLGTDASKTQRTVA